MQCSRKWALLNQYKVLFFFSLYCFDCNGVSIYDVSKSYSNSTMPVFMRLVFTFNKHALIIDCQTFEQYHKVCS